MTAAIGTLAKTGDFSAGDVRDEAELLHTQVLALVRLVFDHSEQFSQDFLSQWNAFVTDERRFREKVSSFFYWSADDDDRDQVFDLEARWGVFRDHVNATIAGGAAEQLPGFSDPGSRTPKKDLIDKAGDALNRASNAAKKPFVDLGWDVIVAVLVLAAGAAGLYYVAAKNPAPLEVLKP